METETVQKNVSALLELYDMHTTFFSSAIEGIADEDAHNRLNTKANHVAWLSGSLVQQRYELANALGATLKQKADDLFKDNKGIRDGVIYPSLTQFKKDWEKISPVLRNALLNASDMKLESEVDMGGETISIYECITFCTYREANCIGQIALWRRLLDYPAMKYQ